MKIGIVGAGIAGIAAAVRLASDGHEVEVFESNAFAGGKLSEFRLGDYRFDFGPSLFTMPQYVDDLFTYAGEKPQQHFNYTRTEVVCNYFWEDGTQLSGFADPEAFALEAEQKTGIPAENVRQTLRDSQRKYDITGRLFLEFSLHRLSTWLHFDILKAMFVIPTLDLFTSMNRVNERLLKHPKMVQLFNRFATYNGSNPYKAPGLLTMIPHFEHGIGCFLPEKGMIDISQSLYQLALRKGAKFYFNQKVESIMVDKGKANGLMIDGLEKQYDAIVSNCDVFYTYKNLLTKQRQPERILQQPKSTSALIFYWGIKRSFKELHLHNILFSNDYKKEFEYLANGNVYEDPTVYVNIGSKLTPSDAPKNSENWFVMINVPHNSGQNWNDIVTETRKNTLDKLQRILGTDVSELIEEETIMDPRTIDSKTLSHLGALYGTSSNNKMAAFMRHPNFSFSIKNLYFCGGSVHPGGGVPLCILSGKIVSELIAKDFKKLPN
jgi:phytoene desaturase